MHFSWYCRYFLSLLMKLMTGMTKWAVTIQGSGESPVAGLYTSQALTKSVARETWIFSRLGGEKTEGERDIRWPKNAYGNRMEKKRETKANGRENGGKER